MTTETKTPPKAIESLQNKKDCLKAFRDQMVDMQERLNEMSAIETVLVASINDPENEELHMKATHVMVKHIVKMSLDAGRIDVVMALMAGDMKKVTELAKKAGPFSI